MKVLIFIALIVSSLHGLSDAKRFFSERSKNAKPSMHFLNTESGEGTVEKLYDQKVDHFSDQGTFKQRYYVNDSFFAGPQAPVFFFICGESTCRKSSLSGHIKNLAQKYGALLVSLEHRYYGESQPFKALTAENLRFLSTRQAIEDLKEFQDFMTESRGLNGQWIAIGGSYPGNLAAYYRLKYPNMVAGALASSAPVMAKEEFLEYDEHVANVSGPHCLANMKKAVVYAEEVINSPSELEKLKTSFQAVEIRGKLDFLYLITEVAAAAVQYGYRQEFCNEINIDEPIKGYAKFARELFSSWGMKAVDFTFQSAESTDPGDYQRGFGMRQWLYQSCTEYGYWQIANPNRELSHRPEAIDLDFHRDTCKRLFGLETPAQTEKINEEYFRPLLSSSTSRIFFTNGTDDPWSVLSLMEDNQTNPHIDAFDIEGAAHCDDLASSSRTDSRALKLARKKFSDHINDWLGAER